MKKLLTIVLIANLILSLISFVQKNRLPPVEDITLDFQKEPIMTETAKEPFETEVNEITYTITPLYDYELEGMVVSYLNSHSFLDYFHEGWQDFINTKDICVIWGNNLNPEVYQNMSFKTQAWTCQYHWPDKKTGQLFSANQLSNNHLLSDQDELNKVIKSVKKGDQVRISGQLVNYEHAGGFQRGTSTTLTDRGDGSCETIWVEDIEIIKKANQGWRSTFTISIFSMIIFLLWQNFI